MTNKIRLFALGLIALMAFGSVSVLAANYDIDAAHSAVTFQVKHLTISKVSGSFGDVAGSFTFAEGESDSWQTEVTIQVSSVDTGNDKRDDHLRNEDFFNAEKFPTIVFKSTGVKMSSDTEGTLMGDLTMHGVTKPVELDMEYNGSVIDPWGNERAGFSLTGKIKRKDWGLTYNSVLESGGVMIGDDIKISLEVEGIKAK
ncbi:MAG: polyisoprenoid-binding protein YceI [Candidatus Krumholzibacteriia bacterium]|jgi:polyisoprenoid-binding protein YceI